MDFLVNPSTFSDAEMADILMHKIKKIKKNYLDTFCTVSPRSYEKLPSPFHIRRFVLFLYDPTWSVGTEVKLCPKTASLSCSMKYGGGGVFKIRKNTNLVTRHRPHYTARSDQHDKNKLLNFWHYFYCCIVIEKRLPVAKHKRGIAGLKLSTVDLSWQLASLLKLADGYNNLHRCWGGEKLPKKVAPLIFCSSSVKHTVRVFEHWFNPRQNSAECVFERKKFIRDRWS